MIQMITAIGVIVNSGFLFFILKLLNSKINGKVDSEFCAQTHKQVDKELTRGNEKFKEIHDDIRRLRQSFDETSVSLARFEERLKNI